MRRALSGRVRAPLLRSACEEPESRRATSATGGVAAHHGPSAWVGYALQRKRLRQVELYALITGLWAVVVATVPFTRRMGGKGQATSRTGIASPSNRFIQFCALQPLAQICARKASKRARRHDQRSRIRS